MTSGTRRALAAEGGGRAVSGSWNPSSSSDGAADQRAVQSSQREWSGALSAASAGVSEKRFLQWPATHCVLG